MKHLLRILTLCFIFCLASLTTKAQYVTISDPNFLNWLSGNFASAMSGNQMDTTNYQLTHATYIGCQNNGIQSLWGVQFFDSLIELDFGVNQVTTLPPRLPATLKRFIGFSNSLTSLPPLPAGLEVLSVFNNQISALPALPAGLKELSIALNMFTALPALLPDSLTKLQCGYNQLGSLPVLPAGLTHLECAHMTLTALPPLPNTLINLDCNNNQISAVAAPNGIQELRCNNNLLTALPPVLSSLKYLDCSNNAITALPALPMGLTNLRCDYNQISVLPPFPDSLYYCHIAYNPINCLPPIKKIRNFFFINTNISCLPNYGNVYSSQPNLNTLPLCEMYNATACVFYNNISGTVYYDTNNNCLQDAGESGINNITVNLWDGPVLLEQTTTHYAGQYAFDLQNYDTHTITIDTAGFPFEVRCPASGIDTSVTTALDSLQPGNDFALVCKPVFDLIARSVSGRFRPASVRPVEVAAGDNSIFYGVSCASGVSGTVQLTINGSAHYVGPADGAVTPSNVTGNTVTWNISDFATVNMLYDFDILIAVDTTAIQGDSICFTLTVNPVAGDYNPTDNVLTHCIAIVGSWDPNDKAVSPSSSIYTSQQWLTYTINFQNTGTDTALNIYVDDTLDTELEAGTFQLLDYSHHPLVQLKGNTVRFNFPNINLPDSNINEPASHGYVQYKVKLKDNLTIGTTINNTAFIYFDFNAPVVTNTTINTMVEPTVGVPSLSATSFSVYPNPANSLLYVNAGGLTIDVLRIFNLNGQLLLEVKQPGKAPVDISRFSAGIYIAEMTSSAGSARKRWVKM